MTSLRCMCLTVQLFERLKASFCHFRLLTSMNKIIHPFKLFVSKVFVQTFLWGTYTVSCNLFWWKVCSRAWVMKINIRNSTNFKSRKVALLKVRSVYQTWNVCYTLASLYSNTINNYLGDLKKKVTTTFWLSWPILPQPPNRINVTFEQQHFF